MLLRVIDFETTGLPPDAAVCEVGWTDLTVRDDATISVGRPHFMLVQPNRPMPPEARAVHHISDADLVGAPAIETGFIKIGAGAVDAFVAHNAQFEQQFFTGGHPGREGVRCRRRSERLGEDEEGRSGEASGRRRRRGDGLVAA